MGGPRSLIKKIEAHFAIDKKTSTCSLRNKKGGVELFAALQFVTSFIHSRAAFHIRDFHAELKEVMLGQKITFDETAWDAQADRISTSFGRLMVLGEATVTSANKAVLRVRFPLIDTDLDPHEYCDPNLFVQDQGPEDYGHCKIEIINFAGDMSLSNDFKLVRADSLV